MSSLTEEQRRRIEQNRLQALAKRQETEKKKAAGAVQQQQQHVAPTNIPPLRFNNQPPQQRSNNFQPQPPSIAQNRGPRPPAPIKVVNGSCYLITRKRFVADIPFHAQTIALFKSIEGVQYDPLTKKWSFPLSQHAKLISNMECLKPAVSIGPLPAYILRTFKNVDTTARIPDDIDLSGIDPVLVQALLPFQRDGVRFGISRHGRVMIADDMGLGKTIQGLGIAHYYKSEWPLLIVTPSSMRFPWRDSIWTWLPSVPAGSIAVCQTAGDIVTSAKVIILSYDLLQKRSQEPALQRCGVIIMDESHNLKNYKTARSKASLPLLQKCKRAILLTGTPALSRPIELYNQISAFKRSDLPSYQEFGIRYCAGKRQAWGWDFAGSSNMPELQLILEETVMIRRLKSEVLQQLPRKTRQIVMLDPSLVQESKSLLQKRKAFLECKKSASRGTLLEYYCETGDVKIEAVKNYVTELVESDKKFLCFAHHKSVISGICDALDKINCSYIKIEGATTSEERKFLVDQFQGSDSTRVAVLSITAANAGITLTAANLVVFAELFWNPGVLVQAEDRAHRIGQEDHVLIQYLVAKGTADDDLWNMVSEKLETLSKAGLSTKESFRDADSDPLIQQRQPGGPGDQKPISDFFKPTPSQEKRASNGGTPQDVKENCPVGQSTANTMDDSSFDDIFATMDMDAVCMFDDAIFEESYSDSYDSVDNLMSNVAENSQGGFFPVESNEPDASKKFKFNK